LAGRAPLHDSLPPGDASSDELLGRFLDYVAGKGLSLYPAQEEAILALFEGQNVIPEHADRIGEVAGRLGPALRLARARPALGLHVPDQGVGQREMDGPVP
jgi:hypothetical protein